MLQSQNFLSIKQALLCAMFSSSSAQGLGVDKPQGFGGVWCLGCRMLAVGGGFFFTNNLSGYKPPLNHIKDPPQSLQ